MTLQEAFEQVEDHRRGPAQRYDLKEMIIMAICAVLCGADSWVDVADWCEDGVNQVHPYWVDSRLTRARASDDGTFWLSVV